MIAGEVVLPQLDDRVRLASGPRIDEPHRLHRPEAQRVDAAMRHHLDRQAAFEEFLFVEIVDRRRLRVHERVVEALVFLARHRTVQVIAFVPIVDSHTRGRPVPPRLRLHRDARNTFVRSMLSASTIGLMAS